MCAVSLTGILLLFGCHSIPRPAWTVGLRIQQGAPIVILEREATGLRMYPTVIQTPDGFLWMASGGGGRVSRDGGGSWEDSGREVVLRTLTGMPDGVVLTGVEEIAKYEGDAILWTGHRVEGGRIVESNMGIRVRGVPPLAKEAARGSYEVFPPGQFWPMSRGAELSDGTILLTAFTRFDGDRLARCVLLASEDGGRSFSYRATVATQRDASWGSEGPNESALMVLPDGDVICVMRTGCDAWYHALSMLQARSSDGGRTWKNHRMMGVRGVNPILVMLGNGVLACTSTRPGNQMVFSADYGRTWTGDLQINETDTGSSAYMDMLALDSNKLLVVYEELGAYSSKMWLWEPPAKKDRVLGVVIQVDRR